MPWDHRSPVLPGLMAVVVATIPSVWAASPKSLTIVADGAAQAVIVTAVEPTKDAADAAEGLRSVTKQMTGVELAITSADQYDGKTTPIFVGPSKAAEDVGVEVQQDVKVGDPLHCQDDRPLHRAGRQR